MGELAAQARLYYSAVWTPRGPDYEGAKTTSESGFCHVPPFMFAQQEDPIHTSNATRHKIQSSELQDLAGLMEQLRERERNKISDGCFDNSLSIHCRRMTSDESTEQVRNQSGKLLLMTTHSFY